MPELYYHNLYNQVRNNTVWSQKLQEALAALNRIAFSVAREAGYAPSGFWNTVKGERKPSFTMLWNIVRYLHVNPDWLFGGEGEVLTDGNRQRDSDEVIHSRIQDLFQNSGMTKSALAREAGISAAEIGVILRGDRCPSESGLHALADTFHVSFYWLMCGDEKSKDNPLNAEMIAWLWAHPLVRKGLYEGSDLQEGECTAGSQEKEETIDLVAFSNRILRIRQENHCSQRAFAEMADISKSTIARWEQGLVYPDEYSIRRAGEALGVGVDWLKYGNESRKDYPCDQRMEEYLNEHPEKRKEIWKLMDPAATEKMEKTDPPVPEKTSVSKGKKTHPKSVVKSKVMSAGEVAENAVGSRVKSRRKLRKMSQSYLAIMAGVSQPFISGIESGRFSLSRGQAKRIAEVLGTDPEYLLSGKGAEDEYPVDDEMIT